MNIFDKNLDCLEQKGKLFIDGIDERVASSLDFIKNEYEDYEELTIAVTFIDVLLSDTVKADMNLLSKLGYWPSKEIEMELDHSIKHALIGSYKSAFSDLRRSLELSIIFIYFSLVQSDEKKAYDWLKSKSDTPYFSNSLKKIVKLERFEDINREFEWKGNTQKFYWLLSDYCHNKGMINGYRDLNLLNSFYGGTSVPSINLETLKSFCDLYLQVVKEIVVIQALYNPIILVGVPFEEKFGIEGPLSGFLGEGSVKLVNQLIPQKYRSFFEKLIDNDEEIKSLVQYFNSLPDLTDKEMEEQIMRQSEFLNSFKDKQRD